MASGFRCTIVPYDSFVDVMGSNHCVMEWKDSIRILIFNY